MNTMERSTTMNVTETTKLRRRGLGALAMALILAAPAGADVVLDWNAELLASIRAERTNPPRATRAMAMMNIAAYDAVVAIAGGYESYADHGAAPAGASAEAAAVGAAHRVLSAVYPGRQAIFDAALGVHLAALPASGAVTDGLAWGQQVADDVLAMRSVDGADLVLPYEAPLGAGWWIRTGPGFAPPLLPNWGYVTPWCLKSGSQLRLPAPPPLTSLEYAAAFDEVKRLGAADSAERTADQSEIALFWNDFAGSETPPGHWSHILQIVSEQQGLGLVENARLFALQGITVADAAIVAWDTKYHWDHWRPATGIHQADSDANPATQADPSWESFITNPPFPSYTSGHSTFSGSSGRLAALFFGHDDIAFDAPADDLPGVIRHFDGFWQASEEAGQSRIYGGIHWQYDNQGGLSSGRALAEHAFYNFLRPTDLAVASCEPSAGHLCLQGGRFAVSARWRKPNGAEGAATPRPDTDEAGSFWFFREENTELNVKLLDGCAGFDHYWVFASGLTNVEVVLTVTDTQSGQVRQYFNPAGDAFRPVQDTAAFATCP
jgi:hypothetical protein